MGGSPRSRASGSRCSISSLALPITVSRSSRCAYSSGISISGLSSTLACSACLSNTQTSRRNCTSGCLACPQLIAFSPLPLVFNVGPNQAHIPQLEQPRDPGNTTGSKKKNRSSDTLTTCGVSSNCLEFA